MFFCLLCFPSVVCGLLRAFFSPLLVLCSPVVPLHTILLVRGGDNLAAIQACTYRHTFHSLCVRGWHSFGVTSCWFSLPVRFSLCSSWRRILALHGTYCTCVLAAIVDGVVCVCFVFARFPLFSFVHVFPFFVIGARTSP